ncbi:hypothetical protein ABID19_001218 [Mesorhizobium robiniae]|uniref:Uncharacterized protein n=1 Tax=Mesorhizobium robiniae TaxID=559315 RepID=A0ABV2GIT2_9HYPH
MGLLTDAPEPIRDAFKAWTEGSLTGSELREHIDQLALTDPAVKSFRESKLSALDGSNDVEWRALL